MRRLVLVTGVGCCAAVAGVLVSQSGYAAQSPAQPAVTQVDSEQLAATAPAGVGAWQQGASPLQAAAAVPTGRAVYGVVTGAGRPVAGYRVEAFTSNGNFIADAVTDANGRYAIVGLQPGPYRVRFAGPNTGAAPWAMAWAGGASTMAKSSVVAVASSPIAVDAKLTRAATVAGWVKGAPAASEVRVCGPSFLDCRITTTDTRGRFTVTGLAAGDGAVFVRPAGGEDLAFPAQPPRPPIPLRAGLTTQVALDAATQAAPAVTLNGKSVKPVAAAPPPDRSAPSAPTATLLWERGKRYVQVESADRQSGVKTVQIRVGDKQLPEAAYSMDPLAAPGKDPVSVRVADKAGNLSGWVVAK